MSEKIFFDPFADDSAAPPAPKKTKKKSFIQRKRELKKKKSRNVSVIKKKPAVVQKTVIHADKKHNNNKFLLKKKRLDEANAVNAKWIEDEQELKNELDNTVINTAESRLDTLKELLTNIEMSEDCLNDLVRSFAESGYEYTEKKVVDAIKTRKPTLENLKTNWDLHVSMNSKNKMLLGVVKTLKTQIADLKKFLVCRYQNDVEYFNNRSWNESKMYRAITNNDVLYPGYNTHNSLLDKFEY